MVISFEHLSLPEKGRHIAKILSDYDHELHLELLPPQHPYLLEQPDKPYAVIHRPLGLPEYIIKVFPESMLDERILAQIFEWDTSRFGGQLDKFDALGMAKYILDERKRADEQEEKREKMKYMLNKRRWE
jgi:hypothetical protein